MIAIGLLLVTFGTAFLWKERLNLRKAWASQGWPTTQGRVLAVSLSNVPVRAKNLIPTYAPDVQYTYTVDGQRHEGTLANERASGSHTRASAMLSPYAPGQKVAVAYDPDDPAVSTIEPGPHRDSMIRTTIAGIGLLIGLVLVYVGIAS